MILTQRENKQKRVLCVKPLGERCPLIEHLVTVLILFKISYIGTETEQELAGFELHTTEEDGIIFTLYSLPRDSLSLEKTILLKGNLHSNDKMVSHRCK